MFTRVCMRAHRGAGVGHPPPWRSHRCKPTLSKRQISPCGTCRGRKSRHAATSTANNGSSEVSRRGGHVGQRPSANRLPVHHIATQDALAGPHTISAQPLRQRSLRQGRVFAVLCSSPVRCCSRVGPEASAFGSRKTCTMSCAFAVLALHGDKWWKKSRTRTRSSKLSNVAV